MILNFTKIQGAGNDFIVIDHRAGTVSLNESQIAHLCHRRFGIGADGLILLEQNPRLRMRIFNSDGKETEGCGNGVRCLGRFLLELGLPPEKTPIQVHDRIVEIVYQDGKIGVDMGEPKDLTLHIPTERGTVHFVDTGVPHLVHFTDALHSLEELGPFWRHHPQFAPRGANVNLVHRKGSHISARTFERGVEGETLSCGTGACAIAAIAHAHYNLPYPFLISFTGGDLEVHSKQNRLILFGPAIKVFEGTFDLIAHTK